ncbi:SCO family protein [Cesiribacter andamanensis]|uniref:BsSco n=1 Tax=Cesiribacter andamanensis AMV16 TaxID=1279009 RepID=M7N6X0_9BACT|nr:SCO family protein [Cesiribacter andamanensis]EMR03027.1 BsSco [Cesiribacter andamanensis AMV16]
MRKTFIILLFMLVPVSIILFLHGFGDNKFEVPVYYGNAADMSSDLCVFPEGQHYIPPFRFTDQQEAEVTEAWLTGKLTVVDFIFTNCPTICPAMSTQMARVQEAFRGDAQVQFLSVTVDPERDTPSVLAAYAERVGADQGRWRFVTGAKPELYELARCGFLLPVQEGDGGEEDFIHSNRLVLVDAQRRIRGYYEGDDRKEVDRLVKEIQIIKAEE